MTSSQGTRTAKSAGQTCGERISNCPKTPPAMDGRLSNNGAGFLKGEPACGKPRRDGEAFCLPFTISETASCNSLSSTSSNQMSNPCRDRMTAQPRGSTKYSPPLTYRTNGWKGGWYKYTRPHAQVFLPCNMSTIYLTGRFQGTLIFSELALFGPAVDAAFLFKSAGTARGACESDGIEQVSAGTVETSSLSRSADSA